MKKLLIASAALMAMAAPAVAGDAEAGEKLYKKCKSCHMIADPAGEVIVKGGKTGPNLYGVVGRVAGSAEFKYGDGLVAANEAGLVWTEESLAAYAKNAKGFLEDNGFPTKTKMTYKLKKGSEDVAAYLASVAPAPAVEEEAASE